MPKTRAIQVDQMDHLRPDETEDGETRGEQVNQMDQV